MTLIKSISGIRGTIGGFSDDNLTPFDIVKYATAYAKWLMDKNSGDEKPRVVIGRDARISGEMLNHLVIGTLIGMGIDVLDLGLSTTPTVEMAVPLEGANGGIILTASHNPIQWNALKLLNHKGEFISAEEGERLLKIADDLGEISFSEVRELGKVQTDDSYIDKHIKEILQLDLVNVDAIRSCHFKVVIDCVNSTGGIALPPLLKALGVKEVIELYCEPNGEFPHNPEPLPENLKDISNSVIENNANLGIVVDPDVDRLAFVSENGSMFGEEYTLVAVADYVLKHKQGNSVSNLSSTRALRDVTENHKGQYFASAVGEVNVVQKMKEVDAIIGGEGNGGIIYPELHYGRDALVGIALFLSHLADFKESISELRSSYTNYFISKNKIELTPDINVDQVLQQMELKYEDQDIDTIDGLKIEFDKEWVHLRKSNTEPIIRVYSESENEAKANALANKIIEEIKEIVKA